MSDTGDEAAASAEDHNEPERDDAQGSSWSSEWYQTSSWFSAHPHLWALLMGVFGLALGFAIHRGLYPPIVQLDGSRIAQHEVDTKQGNPLKVETMEAEPVTGSEGGLSPVPADQIETRRALPQTPEDILAMTSTSDPVDLGTSEGGLAIEPELTPASGDSVPADSLAQVEKEDSEASIVMATEIKWINGQLTAVNPHSGDREMLRAEFYKPGAILTDSESREFRLPDSLPMEPEGEAMNRRTALAEGERAVTAAELDSELVGSVKIAALPSDRQDALVSAAAEHRDAPATTVSYRASAKSQSGPPGRDFDPFKKREPTPVPKGARHPDVIDPWEGTAGGAVRVDGGNSIRVARPVEAVPPGESKASPVPVEETRTAEPVAEVLPAIPLPKSFAEIEDRYKKDFVPTKSGDVTVAWDGDRWRSAAPVKLKGGKAMQDTILRMWTTIDLDEDIIPFGTQYTLGEDGHLLLELRSKL